MAVFSLSALLLWWARRSEVASLWLALFGVDWVLRNWHIAAEHAPFDPTLFWDLTNITLYAGILALYGLATAFMKLSRPRLHVFLLWAPCRPLPPLLSCVLNPV